MKKGNSRVQWEDSAAAITRLLSEVAKIEGALHKAEEAEEQALQYCRDRLVEAGAVSIPNGWPRKLVGGHMDQLLEKIDRRSVYGALETIERLRERLHSLAEFRGLSTLTL